MAYAFDSLQNALDEQEKNASTNIFGTDPNAQQQGTGQDLLNPTTGQNPLQSTTTDASTISSGQPATGSSQNPLQAQKTTNNQAVARAVRSGATKTPKLIADTQAQLTAADTSLQNEANQYLQGARDTSYAVGNEDVDKFIAGDEAAYNKVYGTLGKGAVNAERFAPQTDLSLYNVDALQTDEGMRRALRAEGGAEYGGGMGAFDLATLKRTPGFEGIQKALATQKSGILSKSDQLQESQTAEAQKALEANLAAGKAGITGRLTSQQAGLQKVQDMEAAAANEKAAAEKDALIAAQTDAARQDALASTKGSRLEEYLNNPTGIDTGQFYTGTQATAGDVTNADEAAQFNRILAALGKTDLIQAGTGAPTAGFNKAAYQNALIGGAQERRGVADVGLDKSINDILQRIHGNEASASAAERRNEQAAVDSAMRKKYGQDWADNLVNAEQYQTAPNDSSWQNYVTEADIGELNPLYQQRGKLSTLTAGPGQQNTFDQDAYRAALQAMLSGRETARMVTPALTGALQTYRRDVQNPDIFAKESVENAVQRGIDTAPKSQFEKTQRAATEDERRKDVVHEEAKKLGGKMGTAKVAGGFRR